MTEDFSRVGPGWVVWIHDLWLDRVISKKRNRYELPDGKVKWEYVVETPGKPRPMLVILRLNRGQEAFRVLKMSSIKSDYDDDVDFYDENATKQRFIQCAERREYGRVMLLQLDDSDDRRPHPIDRHIWQEVMSRLTRRESEIATLQELHLCGQADGDLPEPAPHRRREPSKAP